MTTTKYNTNIDADKLAIISELDTELHPVIDRSNEWDGIDLVSQRDGDSWSGVRLAFNDNELNIYKFERNCVAAQSTINGITTNKMIEAIIEGYLY